MSSQHYNADTFAPINSLGYLIKRCGALMATVAESDFASEPITFTQWVALRMLCDHSPLTPSLLSEEMGHNMGALTRLMDALVTAGFARRERDPKDRRAVQIFVTPAGRRQVQKSIHCLVDLLNDLLAPFSKSEVDTLVKQLQRFLERLQTRLDERPQLRVG